MVEVGREPEPLWALEGFEECLDEWEHDYAPSDDLRLVVTAWVLSRFEDPYRGVRREQGYANLWFGPVPRSREGNSIVVCSYWIDDARRRVRCDSFATLPVAS